MKKKAIILDFDHTLYNTTLYVHALKAALAQEGVAPKVFDEKRQYLKDCCNLVDIDTFILQLPHADKARLHTVMHQVIREQAASFVFSDVQDFIDRHSDHFNIIILTQGNHELQTEKTTHSNLTGITQVLIVSEKSEKDVAVAQLLEQYDELHFIDDKAKHIDAIKKRFPQVITYFIQRPEDRPYGDIPSTCACNDYAIEDLSLTIGD